LAFPVTEQGDRWLVPQRLPGHQPALKPEWQGTEVTRLRYRYTALPEGLLPRFITRTYPLSEGRERWVHGVVLELNGARALVRADPADRLVTVAVRGPAAARQRLTGLIRSDLGRIHGDISGLDPDEEIELEDRPSVYVPVRTLEIDEQRRQQSSVATIDGTVAIDQLRELNKFSTPEARDPTRWMPRLFVSYSSRDAKQLDELLVYLKVLRNEGLVETWHDRCLTAGQDWDHVIRRELESADVVLFLVSKNFLATDYVQDVEVTRAVERADAGGAVVVPIILEGFGFQQSRLAKYTALPAKAKPIRDARAPRKSWEAVAEGLRKVLGDVRDQHRGGRGRLR
jgi:internalin A